MNTKRRYRPSSKHNRERDTTINDARLDAGFTWRELAQKAAINKGSLMQIAYDHTGPLYKKTGEIKPWVQKIADALSVDVVDLFPRDLCNFRRKDLFDGDIAYDWEYKPQSPEEAYFSKELNEVIRKQLSKLRAREELIIWKKFLEEKTLEETSLELGVSTERIRQIEAKSLRKLRHHSIRKHFHPFVEYGEKKASSKKLAESFFGKETRVIMSPTTKQEWLKALDKFRKQQKREKNKEQEREKYSGKELYRKHIIDHYVTKPYQIVIEKNKNDWAEYCEIMMKKINEEVVAGNLPEGTYWIHPSGNVVGPWRTK